MKTLLWKEIDNYKVIIGFDKKMIDPIATRESMANALKNSKEINDLSAAKRKHFNLLQKLKQKYKSISEKRKDMALKEASSINLLAKNEALKAKMDSIYDEVVQYFNLKIGEDEISSDALLILIQQVKTAKENDSVMVYIGPGDFEEKKNLKGKKYWLITNGLYSHEIIEKLGDDLPAGAMAELSEDDKTALYKQRDVQDNIDNGGQTKTAEISMVLQQASLRKGEFEVLGDPEALSKAQTWHQSELAKIEIKYS